MITVSDPQARRLATALEPAFLERSPVLFLSVRPFIQRHQLRRLICFSQLVVTGGISQSGALQEYSLPSEAIQVGYKDALASLRQLTEQYTAEFHRVLPFSNPPTMLALQDFNKLVVQHEACLFGYSLDIMARVVQSSSPPKSLEASIEKIAGQEGSVLFARAGRVGNRYLRTYWFSNSVRYIAHTR